MLRAREDPAGGAAAGGAADDGAGSGSEVGPEAKRPRPAPAPAPPAWRPSEGLMLRLALRAAFSTPPPLQPPLFLVVESEGGPMRVLGKAADLAAAKRVLRARVRERCGDERVLRFLFRCFVTQSEGDDWPYI